jgi:hypothetical protein
MCARLVAPPIGDKVAETAELDDDERLDGEDRVE